jgi:hypothetical protein
VEKLLLAQSQRITDKQQAAAYLSTLHEELLSGISVGPSGSSIVRLMLAVECVLKHGKKPTGGRALAGGYVKEAIGRTRLLWNRRCHLWPCPRSVGSLMYTRILSKSIGGALHSGRHGMSVQASVDRHVSNATKPVACCHRPPASIEPRRQVQRGRTSMLESTLPAVLAQQVCQIL